MIGVSGSDTFFFKNGDSHDTITDFNTLKDVIDLRAVSGFHTFLDVQSHAAQVGSDTVITIDANNTMSNVLLSSLQQRIFLLAKEMN